MQAHKQEHTPELERLCKGNNVPCLRSQLVNDEKQSPVKNFENPRWRITAILKSKKLRNLQNHVVNFDEILCDDTY